MARPTDDPSIWSSDANFPAGVDSWNGTPTKVDPGAAQVAAGHEPEDMPPAQWLNWLLNNHGEWLDFLRTQGGRGQASTWLPMWSADTWGASTSAFYALAYAAHGETDPYEPGVLQYLMGAHTGGIWTSQSGDGWVKQSNDGGVTQDFFGAAMYYDAATGNTPMVVCGGTASIQNSNDGSTWTARTKAGAFVGNFMAADVDPTVSAERFVIVGASGEIQYSDDDGDTWTAATGTGANALNAVLWTGSEWVAVGASGEIRTSADGAAWTSQSAAGGYTGTFRSLEDDGNGTIVAVGSDGAGTGEIQYSTDGGATWFSASTTSEALWIAVAFNTQTGMWLAMASAGGYGATSTDGQTWEKIETSSSTKFPSTANDMVYGRDRWILCGDVPSVTNSTGAPPVVMTSGTGE